MRAKILILEDEPKMRRILELVLREADYEVRTAEDGSSGILIWQEWPADIVLSDLKMAPMDGLEVLRYRNRHFPETPFILLTAYGTVETAVQAMKEGAFDYLTKPVDHGQLLDLVRQALAARLGDEYMAEMIGDSATMEQLRKEIATAARTDTTVLITGESGTGKELVARAIHRAYGREKTPFVRINCPAIPSELLENELFGHRRGAFTGAVEEQAGAFIKADGGVLFLDEIGEMPMALQPKLLHAVEQKQVTPLGGAKPQRVRVKIIAATNRDLERMIQQGRFRRDLYYRLTPLHIHLPPLRQRGQDVELLARYFADKFAKRLGKKTPKLSSSFLQCIAHYSWPGNVRELRNVIEALCLKHDTLLLRSRHLPDKMQCAVTDSARDKPGAPPLDLPANERALILQALEQCDWNKSQAARKLGITRNTLRYRMKKYGIEQDTG